MTNYVHSGRGSQLADKSMAWHNLRMRKSSVLLVLVFLTLAAGNVTGGNWADDIPYYPSDAFNGPLVGTYRLVETNQSTLESHPHLGLYSITRDDSGTPIVENVVQLAVFEKFIIGMDGGNYFLINSETTDNAVTHFPDETSFRSAINAAGIPPTIILEAPSVFAGRVPKLVGFPAHFKRMRNLGGMSDDDWAGLGAVILLILMLALGARLKRPRSLLLVSAPVGWTILVWTEFVFPNDMGPCPRFFSFPLFCLAAGWLGRIGRIAANFVARRRAIGTPTYVE